MRPVARTTAILVTLGLVGGAVLGWLLLDGPELPARSPRVRAEAHDAAPAVSGTNGGAASTDSDVESRRIAVDQPSRTPDPQAIRLLVLHPDERPAAGAEVRYLPPGTSIAEGEEDDDLEVMLRRHGAATTTDEHGRVDIVAQRGSDLCARLGDAYAQLDLSPIDDATPQPIRIVLRRDVTLRALVVDQAGAPREGIVVRAEVLAASRSLGTVGELSDSYRTNAAGIATLPHLQEQLPMPGPDVVRWQLEIVCHPFEEQSASVQVQPAELTRTEPFRLVVPTGGSILARVLDADGKPWFGGTWLRDVATGDERQVHHNDLRDGTQWFRQVPLGGRWQLRGDYRGDPVFTSDPFVGPATPDQIVTMDVTVPEREWHVHGRLVRPDGVPLERTPVACRTRHVADERPPLSYGSFHFRHRLPAALETIDDLVLDVHLQEAPTRVRIERTLRSGRTDLGDVVVPMPTDDVLLAAVTIRGGDRVLSGTATVQLGRAANGDFAEVFTVRRLRGTELELHGQPSIGNLQLSCHHVGFRSAQVPIRAGEHRVVELAPLAELVVRVRPPVVPRGLVRAVLVRNDDVDECRLERGDQFHWQDLEPGRYGLRIVVDTVVCFELPRFDVTAGGNAWPTDGSRLDLHDSVRAFHLDIRPADGIGEVEDAQTFIVPPHVSATDLDAKPQPAANWFIARRQPVDVLVRAPGFVPTRLPAPTRDLVVPLTRCTKVEVLPPADPDSETVVRVVHHGLDDPVLRAIDEQLLSGETWIDREDPEPLTVAPGTVLEVVVERQGNAGPPRRVVVGTTSPQVVDLR